MICFFVLVNVLMDNILVSPWVLIVWSIWPLLSLFFSYEFDFLNCLLKNNTCPVVLHKLSLDCRLWIMFLFLIFQTLRILCT